MMITMMCIRRSGTAVTQLRIRTVLIMKGGAGLVGSDFCFDAFEQVNHSSIVKQMPLVLSSVDSL